MQAVPLVGISTTHTCEIGPGSLRAKLEWTIVNRLAGHRIRAVALGLRSERPHHLRVARVAALSNIDVTALELQRGVWHDTFGRFDGFRGHDQRNDLRYAADAYRYRY